MEKIILTNMCLIENPQTNEVVVIHRVKNWKGIAFPGGHIEQASTLSVSKIPLYVLVLNINTMVLSFVVLSYQSLIPQKVK